MCGLTGFVDFNKRSNSETLDRMVATLAHRGPDDRGKQTFRMDSCIVGLGHSRLSVIDTSSAGHQPMKYESLHVVFNGEIYNYEEIKSELISLGHKFNSGSDTEVILHAVKEWGVDAVARFVGMFVIVLFDEILGELYILRDRAGVKPLYYYYSNGLFLFSSELKSFHEHPDFSKEINSEALAAYFDLRYVPSPNSIFKDSHKLEPASILNLTLSSREIVTRKYWNVFTWYEKEKLKIDYEEAKSELLNKMKKAFSYRMVSDVPVGIFLSGGYDSSAVTSILQSDSTRKLKTFTIGFESGNNEAPAARQTADYLGTDHTEQICTEEEAKSIIQELPYFFDEPFADQSAIPTILVSRLAREKVTVALSADGGDEIFSGYTRYVDLHKRSSLANRIPAVLKKPVGGLFRMASSGLPSSKISLKHRLHGLGSSLNSDRMKQAMHLYKHVHSLPRDFGKIFKVSNSWNNSFNVDHTVFNNEVEMAMAIDYKVYMQDDILTKVDRSTMSVSLEGREPLLDHNLLEFSAQLPYHFKYQNNSGKRILKDIVHDYIPKDMMNRPKAGFSVPVIDWLQGDLSYLIDEFMSREALDYSGLFNTPVILDMVKSFKKGTFYYSPLIWRLLAFQMWYKRWM